MFNKLMVKVFWPLIDKNTRVYIRRLEIDYFNVCKMLDESIDREINANRDRVAYERKGFGIKVQS